MICNKCGQTLPEDARFCRKCGAPVTPEVINSSTVNPVNQNSQINENQQQQTYTQPDQSMPTGNQQNYTYAQPDQTMLNENQQSYTSSQLDQSIKSTEEPPKKKKKSKKSIIIVMVIILFVIAVIGVFLWINRPVNKVLQALNSGNIEVAAANYREIDDYNDIEKIEAEAIEYAKQIQSDFLSEKEGSDYSVVSAQLKQLQSSILNGNDEIFSIISLVDNINTSRAAYSAAVKLKDAERYGEAIIQYRNVINEDEKYYTLAQNEIVELISIYRQDILDEAKSYEDSMEYEEALSALRHGLLILENDTELLSEIAVLESIIQEDFVTVLSGQVDTALKNEDYLQALDLVESGMELYPDNAQLDSIRDNIIEQYKAAQMVIIDEYMATHNVTEILNILNDMQLILPDDEDIPVLIQFYSEKMPVSLTDIPIYKDSTSTSYFGGCSWKIVEEMSDTYGNTYYNAVRLVTDYYAAETRTASSGKGELEFLNNDGYRYIAGTLSYENSSATDGSVVFTVYADDNIVYTSPEITDSSEPISFLAELGECHKYAIFWTSGRDYDWGISGHAILSDARVWKD